MQRTQGFLHTVQSIIFFPNFSLSPLDLKVYVGETNIRGSQYRQLNAVIKHPGKLLIKLTSIPAYIFCWFIHCFSISHFVIVYLRTTWYLLKLKSPNNDSISVCEIYMSPLGFSRRFLIFFWFKFNLFVNDLLLLQAGNMEAVFLLLYV